MPWFNSEKFGIHWDQMARPMSRHSLVLGLMELNLWSPTGSSTHSSLYYFALPMPMDTNSFPSHVPSMVGSGRFTKPDCVKI